VVFEKQSKTIVHDFRFDSKQDATLAFSSQRAALYPFCSTPLMLGWWITDMSYPNRTVM
jgi:hypothetical protein